MEPRARVFGLAMLLETGIGLAGVTVASLAGVSLQSQLAVTPAAVGRGVVATLPLLIMLVLLTTSRWGPLVALRRQIDQIVATLFAHSRWPELALICLAAGVGEELAFSGTLQPLLTRVTHPAISVAVVSLLFGLAHAMSTTYFVAATAIGVYFGWLAMAYDDLIAPMVAHGLYDFIALSYVQRRVRGRHRGR